MDLVIKLKWGNMFDFLEGVMPLRMLWDFLPLFIVVTLGFIIVTLVETLVLKMLKRLEAPKNLFYAISANVLGFFINIILGVILIYAFAFFFGSTMGGQLGIALISLVVLVVAIAFIPILMFLTRFFLFRFFGVTETKFRVVYALVSTFGVYVIPIAYLAFLALLNSLRG